MTRTESFGLLVLIAAAVGIGGILSNRVSERFRIPAPAIFLLCSAAVSDLMPGLRVPSVDTVEKVVTVALAIILFDGGMQIGWARFRAAAGAIVWMGVAGTVVTAGVLAVLAHLLFSLDWHPALLLGTALAPTDPAVVFSVLGRREIGGRSGVIIQGESGANDPVGIALLIALLAAPGAGFAAAGSVALVFSEQMIIGGAVGIAGGLLLTRFMRRVPLPSEGLYPLRVLAVGLAIYGFATVAHGSGFLAVFLAGVIIGDERAPYKGEIERFHSALASMAEIVAFVLLGLTIELGNLPDGGAWYIGLILAVLLTFLVRPLFVGAITWPIRLRPGERLFVLLTGLKGAVPILLGAFIVIEGVPDAARLYGIIFTVVGFSVIVQGGAVPSLARRLGVPLRTVEPEPWSLGVRFRHEPHGLHRYRVAKGSVADGTAISDLPGGEGVWVSFVIREGHLVPVTDDTILRSADEVLVLSDPEEAVDLDSLFCAPSGREKNT